MSKTRENLRDIVRALDPELDEAAIAAQVGKLAEAILAVEAHWQSRLDKAEASLKSQKGRTAAAESTENHVKGARDSLQKAYLALDAECDYRREVNALLRAERDALVEYVKDQPCECTAGSQRMCWRCVVLSK